MIRWSQLPAPRLTLAGAAVVALAALGIGVASANDRPARSTAGTAVQAGAQTINCPTVADKLPAIPAGAQAEVARNLALLDTQIDEANRRLVSSTGQGGPNFVQNAILGPLADKRRATLDRIAISIGRQGAARPAGLEALATCSLGSAQPPANQPPATQPPATQPPAAQPPAAQPGAARPTAISCPTVADKLPAIPAGAQAEVARNLALLDTQIDEANRRLAATAGQGGANFVQNAILGPLADKRRATLDRITISIGRQGAARPAGLDALATCTAV